MYEVNDQQKRLVTIGDNLKKSVDNEELEGVLVIKLLRNKEIELAMEFGQITQFEWVGILDFVSDAIKGHYEY